MVFDDHAHSATHVPNASLSQGKVYQHQQQQSPNYGACKPFSYLPAAQSPKFPRQSRGDSHGDNVYEDFSEDGNQNTNMDRLDSQDMNGHSNKAVGRNPPNPAVAYGKHESVFQPQPHRPPPKGPPPPPPPGEPGQNSPKPQRHSECIDSGNRPSPMLQKKNSGRSYSEPCVEGELPPYRTPLPAPPPPVSVKENYLAAALEATRPPSPPLPPPPPELQRSSNLTPLPVPVLASSAQSVHPPAPPPISTIPTNKDRVSKSVAKDQDPVSPKGLNSPSPDVSRGGNLRVPVVPKMLEHSDKLVKELQTVQLTKTDSTDCPAYKDIYNRYDYYEFRLSSLQRQIRQYMTFVNSDCPADKDKYIRYD
ncbi:hypothetical protein CHS0354_021423 [Potamilus streckersoni]|uniref:Uncharacterized protein n=1 Tax=Potamilus streckersoni TaxID=2493646 RepID=A0AAE0VMT4_9BIVA|nr:hypothetical protein CHS0354_021423 [Potamilus streckersoni]